MLHMAISNLKPYTWASSALTFPVKPFKYFVQMAMHYIKNNAHFLKYNILFSVPSAKNPLQIWQTKFHIPYIQNGE